jgi:tetratricopeptide (TPR) repeat protein/DNA-binding MarR family transcriptional regulator
MVGRGSRITLSIQEKIALHLGEFTNLKEEFEVPFAITQDGIARAINIERSNLPRELKKLINRSFVVERVAHVIGKSRRRKTYNLTPDGKVHANQIKNHLNKIPIIFKGPDGSKVETNLLNLYSDLRPKISLFEIINNITDTGEFELSDDVLSDDNLKLEGIRKPEHKLKKTIERSGSSIVEHLDQVPQIRHFFGRIDEINQINKWLKTPSYKLIVIYGIAGIGKTTLVSKLIRQYRKSKGTYWYRCHESDTIKTIITPISVFMANYGKNKLKNYLETKKIVNIVEISDILENELQNINAIFVFDDFQKVDKGILQFFSILLQTIEKLPGIKFMISTRKLVPFYDTRDISLKRTVTELQLQGLDKKSSLKLLKLQKFMKIDDVKFQNIYESTAGHPLALELLTTFTEPERKSDFIRFVEDEIFSELSSEQKNILNAASVHRYPIELPCFFVDEGTTYDQLSELLKRSLVYKLTNNRYDLHDLVREFVLNHLTENQKQSYHRSASQYYSLNPSPETEIEQLYHLVKAHKFKDAALMAIEKGQDLINSGHLELNYILEELNISALPVGLKSDILLLKGDVAVATGELDTAFDKYEESLKLILKTGKSIKLAKIYRKMAVLYSHQNDWDKAVEFYNKALKIFQSEGETKELAKIYNNLALVYYNQDDNKKTIDFYNKSIDLLD